MAINFPVPSRVGQTHTDTTSGNIYVCTSLSPTVWAGGGSTRNLNTTYLQFSVSQPQSAVSSAQANAVADVPSWAKRITLLITDLRSGPSLWRFPILQLVTAKGIQTSGYKSLMKRSGNAFGRIATSTTDLEIDNLTILGAGLNNEPVHATITLTNSGTNTWICTGDWWGSGNIMGTVTLPSALTQIVLGGSVVTVPNSTYPTITPTELNWAITSGAITAIAEG